MGTIEIIHIAEITFAEYVEQLKNAAIAKADLVDDMIDQLLNRIDDIEMGYA